MRKKSHDCVCVCVSVCYSVCMMSVDRGCDEEERS